jgi:hypothetical protein
VARSLYQLGYDLDDGFRSPAGVKDFSPSLCIYMGSGSDPASYPMSKGDPFPGGEPRPDHKADHSPPFVPRSRAIRNYTFFSPPTPEAPPWRVAEKSCFSNFRSLKQWHFTRKCGRRLRFSLTCNCSLTDNSLSRGSKGKRSCILASCMAGSHK